MLFLPFALSKPEFDGMSQCAIATDIVDRVLPPQEIAQTLNQESDRAGITELLRKSRKLAIVSLRDDIVENHLPTPSPQHSLTPHHPIPKKGSCHKLPPSSKINQNYCNVKSVPSLPIDSTFLAPLLKYQE